MSEYYAIRRYFDSERFIGEGERQELGYWQNIAYFCPYCGKLWGRVIYEYSPPYISSLPWRLEGRACLPCGDGQLLADDTYLGGKLDKALLTRELLVQLERYPA